MYMYCIWRCFNRIRWLVTHWHMTIHDHTTVCSYIALRNQSESTSFIRLSEWLGGPVGWGTQVPSRISALIFSCLFADVVFQWLVVQPYDGESILACLFIKYPFWNNLGWSCSSWSPSRQGNLRRSMSLTSNTSVKAAGWVDEHPTDCITTPRERSSRKIRCSSKHRWYFFWSRKTILASSGIWTYTGWWFGTFFIFYFIYGMSSFPLTFIFFRGVGQPPTSIIWSFSESLFSSAPTLRRRPALPGTQEVVQRGAVRPGRWTHRWRFVVLQRSDGMLLDHEKDVDHH